MPFRPEGYARQGGLVHREDVKVAKSNTNWMPRFEEGDSNRKDAKGAKTGKDFEELTL